MAKAKTKTSSVELMVMEAAFCLRDDRLQDAIAGYRNVLALQAENRVALFNLAQALHELGQKDEFTQIEKRFLALGPGPADIEIRKGAYLHARAKYREAIACYNTAFGMGRKDYELYRGLGDAYLDNGEANEALGYYAKAQKLHPRDAALWALIAEAQFALGQYREAIESAHKALAIDPELTVPKCAAAWCYLMLGDYEKGLKLNEERLVHNSRERLKKIGVLAQLETLADKPRWQGEDLQGKTILVWTEQGLGDSIMMMRYIPMLMEKGASGVAVCCHPSLIKTMLTVTPLVISMEAAFDKSLFDVHCSMMSLPFCFGTRLDSIPASTPYVKTAPSAQKIWGEQLRRFPGLKVGLAWAGSKGLARDKLRSLAFESLAPLFDVPGVQYVSLQKEAAVDAAQIAERHILDWMSVSNDLMDTAALISQLDVVVTVDTMIAHLAGALGKPVWMLNRFESEWRWMRERTDSLWYPSMRIFRQPVLHDWDSVMRDVVVALTELASPQAGKTLGPAAWQKAAHDANRALGVGAQSADAGGWGRKLMSFWKH